jgi:hypothetical protein
MYGSCQVVITEDFRICLRQVRSMNSDTESERKEFVCDFYLAQFVETDEKFFKISEE